MRICRAAMPVAVTLVFMFVPGFTFAFGRSAPSRPPGTDQARLVLGDLYDVELPGRFHDLTCDRVYSRYREREKLIRQVNGLYSKLARELSKPVEKVNHSKIESSKREISEKEKRVETVWSEAYEERNLTLGYRFDLNQVVKEMAPGRRYFRSDWFEAIRMHRAWAGPYYWDIKNSIGSVGVFRYATNPVQKIFFANEWPASRSESRVDYFYLLRVHLSAFDICVERQPVSILGELMLKVNDSEFGMLDLHESVLLHVEKAPFDEFMGQEGRDAI